MRIVTAALSARMIIEIEMALAGIHAPPALIESQAATARALGLSRAEIDAARRGRSFDARSASAVQLAIALSFGDKRRINAAQRAAAKAGLDRHEIADIAAVAAAAR